MIFMHGNTTYSRENDKFYRDGIQVDEVPEDIAYEFERQDRKRKELLEMNGKVVEVSYNEKHGYFLKYKNGDEYVILDPIRYCY